MTRTVHRGMPDAIIQAAHLFIANKIEEAAAKAGKGTKEQGPYATIAAWCRSHGEKDAKGHYTWKLSEAITIGARRFTGFRLQASHPSPYFDTEAAQALITSLGPEAVAAATHTEIVWDYDHLFLLRQQEKITGEQLDAVLITPAAEYSLMVLEDK